MEESTREGRATERRHLALLLGLTFALTLIAILQRPIINNDGIRYVYCAQLIEQGRVREAIREQHPMIFVPFLIACVHKVVPDWTLAARIVNFLPMTLAAIPLYLLVRDLFGRPSALWSGVFFALIPDFRKISAMIVRDGPFLFLLAWHIWALTRLNREKNAGWHVLAFSTAIGATLCRTEGVFALGVYALVALVGLLSSPSRKIRAATWIAIFTLALCGGTAALSPKIEDIPDRHVRSALTLLRSPGEFLEKSAVFRVYWQLKDIEIEMREADPLKHGGLLMRATRSHIMDFYFAALMWILAGCAYPTTALLSYFGMYMHSPGSEKKLAHFPTWLVAAFAALPLCSTTMLVGSRQSEQQKARRKIFLYLCAYLVLIYAFSLYYDYLSERYLLAAAMILCIWSGPGFLELRDSILRKVPHRLTTAAFLSVFLLLPCCEILTYRASGESNILDAARWLRENAPEASGVVTNEPRILYYADIHFSSIHAREIFPNAESQELQCRARELGARFAVWRGRSETPHERTPIASFPGRREILIFDLQENGCLRKRAPALMETARASLSALSPRPSGS